MKKALSALLACLLLFSCVGIPALAVEEDYSGKTVILYTGNIRGDLEVYPKIAALEKQYEAAGADVILADVGNYLQGSVLANSDRGAAVYDLMDAVGYDVAGMALAEFSYTDAVTGYPYHGNVTRYYTQAMLQNGTDEIVYNKDAKGEKTAVLPARGPAGFHALSSRVSAQKQDVYSWEQSVTIETASGFKAAFHCVNDPAIAEQVQDGFLAAVGPAVPDKNDAVFTVCLCSAGEEEPVWGDLVIRVPDGDMEVGACVIDNGTLEVVRETIDLSAVTADPQIAALVDAVKERTAAAVGVSEVILCGSDKANWNGETNLGDLTCDALKWYAETYLYEIDPAFPVVAVQNGGNCDQFLYTGEIAEVDLLRALPFSPMGIGVLQVTGAQLLETIEAATQQEDCPGFAQVAGLTYTLNVGAEYDAGATYGKYFECDSIGRVTIETVCGQPFDPAAVYNLVCDNFLMNGNDTYYTLKAIKEADGTKYVNNGNGVKVRDVVARYIKEVLGGTIGETYAAPQGRITVTSSSAEAVEWAARAGVIENAESFKALAACSRAQAVTMLWRAAGSPTADGAMEWSDVDPDAACAEALRWATAANIVNGVGGGRFDPDRAVTREEAAVMLYRLVQNAGSGFTGVWMFPLGYEDAAEVSTWADEAVHWMVMQRCLTPRTGDRLDPGGPASFGTVVAMLYGIFVPQD